MANMTHELKCWPEYFQALKRKDNNFEIRKEDDKKFEVGDWLHLREYDPPTESYTGDNLGLRVKYVLRGPVFGLQEGYCIMSLV